MAGRVSAGRADSGLASLSVGRADSKGQWKMVREGSCLREFALRQNVQLDEIGATRLATANGRGGKCEPVVAIS
jgi:hypothetical protein